ncbi:MAG TPA: VOC family protein [Balneolaceae bacterium]|nr:VOC family protein [Balneolaceae bacterium]
MNPVVHFEMPAEDKKRMADFYAKVFGWQTKQLGPDMGEYVLVTTTDTDENGMVQKPGTINGGFYTKSDESLAKYPSIVIAVEDIKESIKKVTQLGGKVHGEPDEIPGVGQFVYFEDTEGNTAGMLQPFME